MSYRMHDEDLFEDSKMSFGEHLEELRIHLIRALIGVAVGCVVGFMAAEWVVNFLTVPLQNAVSSYRQAQSRDEAKSQFGYSQPEWEYWFREENYAPEKMMIDPAELANALESLNPDLTKDIDLRSYEFKKYHFWPAQLPLLCERLFSDTDNGDLERLRFLREKLSESEASELKQIAEKAGADDEDVATLMAVFNRVSGAEDLSSAAPFQPWVSEQAASFWDVLIPAEDNPLIGMRDYLEKNPDDDLRLRINRILIQKCFADQMPPIRQDLIPMQIWRKIDVNPQALGTTEGFMIWLKAGLYSGLLLASPWVLLQLWLFVTSGLYPHEKKYVYVFLPISLLLFFSGAALAFFFVFEPVLDFLFSFNASLGITPQIRINEWLSFVMFLPLGFGVAFQLPLVMLFLNRINLFSVPVYISKWRIAVMVIFTLSMLLTPADPISMIMLAIPLTFLYFFGIGLCLWLPQSSSPFGDPPPVAGEQTGA